MLDESEIISKIIPEKENKNNSNKYSININFKGFYTIKIDNLSKINLKYYLNYLSIIIIISFFFFSYLLFFLSLEKCYLGIGYFIILYQDYIQFI